MIHGLQDSFQTLQQGGKVLFENGCHHLHVHAEVLVDKEIAGGHDLPPGDFGLKALEILGNAPGRFTENLQKANQGEGRFLLGERALRSLPWAISRARLQASRMFRSRTRSERLRRLMQGAGLP